MFGRKKKKVDGQIDEQAAKRVRDEALDEQDAVVEEPKPRRAAVDDDAVKAEDAVDTEVAEVEDKSASDDTLAAADKLSEEAATEPARAAEPADEEPGQSEDDENDDGEAKDAEPLADDAKGESGDEDTVDSESDEDDSEGEDSEDDGDDEEEPTDEWEEFANSRDWREDGPFDYDEVDLEGDEVQRADFGSLILTPTDQTQLQLQVEQETGNVQAALVMIGQSGLEIALFAAPTSGGLAKTVRDEMLASVETTGGSCEFAEGPFGPEVRRIVPVRMPDGQEGLHVSRTWLAEGPRWLLRGVLMGEACVSEDASLQDEFVEFFKNLIVRRGDVPLPPGELIPMTLPDELKPQQPQA